MPIRAFRFSCIAVLLLAAALPARAAEGTIRLALSVLPPQLGNPFSTSATPTITTTSAIYDGLTRMTAGGVLKPWLALSWANVDARTWRFQLRRDVVFSNGKPFTAATVAANVNFLAKTPRPTDNILRDLPPLEGARVVDEFTVDIVTKMPVPTFPRYAAILLMPESESFLSLGTEEFSKTPVGTGPFALEKWEPNKASFKAFAKSWRKPKEARLELLTLPEATARVQAIISGRADIGIGLAPEDVQTLEAAGSKGISWRDGSVAGISLVATRGGPLADARVRRALNHAVNRGPIVDILFQGKTVPANQPAARNIMGRDDTLPMFDYDLDKAKRLLAEAGYPKGFKFVMETATTSGASLAAYQQVADDLADIGVTMEIRPLQLAQYLRNTFITGEYADAIFIPWSASPSMDVLRAINIHSCQANHPWYCDREAMPVYQAALAEWDEAKGLELRRELGRRYHDQAAALFLYEQVFFAGLSKRTEGFADTFGFISYDTITVSGK
ncbi:MAG: ABC transporter substrate-binding protein [Rhodospirillaceae bacterium]|nr:ABC transporter substrate-binding protein [Rhodospirillaceae bacterium]